MLDNIVRLVVWSSMILSILAPAIAAVLLLFGAIPFPPLLGDPGIRVLSEHPPAVPRAGLVTGSDASALERLKSLAAMPGEAIGAVDRLHIAVVEVAGEPALEDGFRTLELDLSAAGSAALLIVSDQPVRLHVSKSSGQRARLAFEGQAPFDLVGGGPGLLAGFRSRALGASDTMDVAGLSDLGRTDASSICASLTLWAQHFGISLAEITINPAFEISHLSVSPDGIGHDGRTAYLAFQPGACRN